jgi:hypothetical protein
VPQHGDLDHIRIRRPTTAEHNAEQTPHDHQRHRTDNHEQQTATTTPAQVTQLVREMTPFTH